LFSFAIIIIPLKEYFRLFRDRNILTILSLLLVLLSIGYVSSYLSDYPYTALRICNRISFYYAILIICIASVKYFENASNFIINTFVYANSIVIIGSILDFYSPQFHRVLIQYFNRPEVIHSYIQIGSEKIMRPMGFVTDSNLTAFSITLALLLLLINHDRYNKIFRLLFYIAASYVTGMLTSRGSLVMCVVCIVVFFSFRLVDRKELIIFVVLFLAFQLITPQTYGRILSSFNKEKMEEEYTIGRPVIWNAALKVFSENPVIGKGPGVFFEVSQTYLRGILKENPSLNIDNPDLPSYHKIDKLNPHNIFLVMLAETGLTGFAFFILLVVFLIIIYYKNKIYISLLLFLNILMVSALSNFAPYYKYYLMIVIIFYVTSNQNNKLSSLEIKLLNIKKLLVFKLCCLGDTVFITPAIDSLRKKYPDSIIEIAYSEWVQGLYNYIPNINGGILFKNVFSNNFLKKLLGTIEFISKARKEKYDMVLYTHRSHIFSLILFLCGIKIRLGFKGTRFLTHKVKFEKHIPEYKRYLDILSKFGLDTIGFTPSLIRPNRDSILERLNLNPETVIIGIFPMGGLNPGTKMSIKRWELENFFTLIDLINSKYPEMIIILFEGKTTIERIDHPDNITIRKEFINNEILSVCDYFISADTGSLHIAASMGIPTLSIFGPSDPRLLAPNTYKKSNIKHITIWQKPECSPCYTPDTAIDRENKKHWRDNEFYCHTGTHICMKSITAELVFEEFKNLLKSNPL
jgi:ADP-heptose:LPS heptosyltransferase